MPKLSEAEREAQKKAQIARIAAKGSPEYHILYAQQPDQVKIATEQKAQLKATRQARAAIASLQVQNAETAAEIFGGVNLTGGES